jgi:ribonuclease D
VTSETPLTPQTPREVTDLLEPRDGIPPVVDSPRALAEATERLAAGDGPVAVDAERASGYRYGQRAYLVQLRRRGAGTLLIDPIACPDLSGVDAALADAEAVLHAASQDLPCLAEVGYRPRRLFDTELAGRLLGYPRVALGTLTEEVLGLRLEKGHSAADWSVRPLPAEMLRYAALDVEVLVELRDALAEQLDDAGKAGWARQEFEAIVSAPPPSARPDPWRRTSGIHRVHSRRGLGVIRELWNLRDRIAREDDLSPHRVLVDQAIKGFTARVARRHIQEWLTAVRAAKSMDEGSLPEITGSGPGIAGAGSSPPPAHRWSERDPAAAARLAATREAIAVVAERHTLPVENLIPPDAVRRLSWDPPDPADQPAIAAALSGYGARPWQADLVAGPIAAALRAAAATTAATDAAAATDGPGPS